MFGNRETWSHFTRFDDAGNGWIRVYQRTPQACPVAINSGDRVDRQRLNPRRPSAARWTDSKDLPKGFFQPSDHPQRSANIGKRSYPKEVEKVLRFEL